MIDKLKKAVELCVSEDKMRPWMTVPFYASGWNAATNAHVLVGYKGEPVFDPCAASEESIDRMNEWLSGKSKHRNSGTITIDDIQEAMDKWPVEDEYEQVKCSLCDGTGIDDHPDDECFQCDGSGKVEGSKVVGKKPNITEKLFLEGVAYFMPGVWSKLLEVCKAIDATELTITHGAETQFVRLEVKDSKCVIIIMPAHPLFAIDQGPFMVITPKR